MAASLLVLLTKKFDLRNAHSVAARCLPTELPGMSWRAITDALDALVAPGAPGMYASGTYCYLFDVAVAETRARIREHVRHVLMMW